MIKYISFHLANALLGLLVILLSFSGLPSFYKTVFLVIFGLLIILFSLAEIGGRPEQPPRADGVNKNQTPN